MKPQYTLELRNQITWPLGRLGDEWPSVRAGVEVFSGTDEDFSFEPSDNGTYTLSLVVLDDDGDSGSVTTTINVTNVAPTASLVGVPVASVPEGSTVQLDSVVSDDGPLDQSFTYAWSVVYQDSVVASGTESNLTFTPVNDGLYNVKLIVTDKDDEPVEVNAQFNVSNVNPTASIVGAPDSGLEGTPISLGSSVDDVGVEDVLTLNWTVNKDGSFFRSGSGPDFEFTPDDNGLYEVTIDVTDGDGGSASASREITVNDVAPTLTVTGDALAITGEIYTLTLDATDPGDDTIDRWFITWGDGTSNTVEVTDFTSPILAEHVYDAGANRTVTATAIDEDGAYSKTINVTVNERPMIADQGLNIDEGLVVVGTIDASDGNLPDDSLTFEITGFGPDDSLFQITNGNRLEFKAAPDFENPTDTGGTAGDNIYLVGVQVQDSFGETDTATISVTVTPVNDNTPEFQSATDVDVAENSSFVQTLIATDDDDPAPTITYMITGGVDEDKFEIVGDQLQFKTAPDFETPGDDGGDNVYIVEVEASDGELTTTEVISVTVTDAVELVDIDDAPNAIDEDAADGTSVGIKAFASDAVTYSLIDDAGGRFAIDADSGLVTVADSALLDGNSAHTISVLGSDGSNADFDIAVENVAPVLADLESSATFTNPSTNDEVVVSGSFVDVLLDTHTVRINWGDNTPEETIAVDQLNDTFLGQHAYATGGIFDVTVTVIDDDGDEAASTTVAVVAGVGVQNGVLQVVGSNASESIKVTRKNSSTLKVRIKEQGQTSQVYLVGIDGLASIHVLGSDGNELIAITTSWSLSTFLDGGAGNDLIFGGSGIDFIHGGTGDDELIGRNGVDTIFGGAGDDWIWGNNEGDFLDGGSGNDHIFGCLGDDQIWGGDGNDVIHGDAGDDFLDGGNGDDLLWGGTGNDTIVGGSGDDIIFGGIGDDVLNGESGDDLLFGGPGSDSLDGGEGLDWLFNGWWWTW